MFFGVQRVNGGVDAEGARLGGFGTAQAQQAFELVEGVAEALAFAGVGEHGDANGRARFEVHRVAGRWALAVLLRREAVFVAEAARKGLGVVVAAFACDVGEGFVGVADEPGGAVQTHPFDGGVQGFAHDVAVEAVPVPGREAGGIGDAVEVNAVGVVVFQIVQGAEEALFVVTFFHDFYDTASQRVLSLPQGDVVLAVAVGGIYLQANRDFQKRLQVGEGQRFFFADEVNQLQAGDDGHHLRREVARFAHQVAEEFISDGFHGFDVAPPLATRAGFAHQLAQAFARAFARHLDDAQRRNRADGVFAAVSRECGEQRVHHALLVFGVVHVDEIEHDDAAEVAQAQLAGDGARRFEVGFVDGVVLREFADECAGIDVYRRHRLGLVDDEVAAGFERDVPFQRQADFFFDAVALEQAAVAAVKLQPRLLHAHEKIGGERLHFAVRAGVIDHHAAHAGADEIAQHFLIQRQFAINERPRPRPALLLHDGLPHALQILHVGAHRPHIRRFNRGAHDKAALPPLVESGDRLAQRLPLFLRGDFDGHANFIRRRQKDEKTRGDGNLHRQPRALAANRVFQHLHQKRLPLAQHIADAFRRLVATAHHIFHVQKSGALQTNINKCRIHARQHPLHLALINIADDAALALALDEKILQHAVFQKRDPRLIRRVIDQNLRAQTRTVHIQLPSARKNSPLQPNSQNPCHSACNGKPMTL